MSRGRAIVLIGLMVVALAWVATRGLAGNLVYYVTPSDLLQKSAGASGERVRLGGYVLPGTLVDSGTTVQFVVSDGSNRMPVVATHGVPSLFREGRGVVLEGVYGADGAFHADTVLVKHDNVYRPPAPGQSPPHEAKLQGSR